MLLFFANEEKKKQKKTHNNGIELCAAVKITITKPAMMNFKHKMRSINVCVCVHALWCLERFTLAFANTFACHAHPNPIHTHTLLRRTIRKLLAQSILLTAFVDLQISFRSSVFDKCKFNSPRHFCNELQHPNEQTNNTICYAKKCAMNVCIFMLVHHSNRHYFID